MGRWWHCHIRRQLIIVSWFLLWLKWWTIRVPQQMTKQCSSLQYVYYFGLWRLSCSDEFSYWLGFSLYFPACFSSNLNGWRDKHTCTKNRYWLSLRTSWGSVLTMRTKQDTSCLTTIRQAESKYFSYVNLWQISLTYNCMEYPTNNKQPFLGMVLSWLV